MGMQVGSQKDDEPMMDMNTTPLIDVMLVLLVMLIITIPIQTHAVKLNMPQGTPPNGPHKEPVVVTLDIDLYGGIYWNGEKVPDRQVLEFRLRNVAAQPDQDEIHLRPNKDTGYDHVAMVLATAQRLGVTKIGLVGNEQFVE